jgi:hypothetical protein
LLQLKSGLISKQQHLTKYLWYHNAILIFYLHWTVPFLLNYENHWNMSLWKSVLPHPILIPLHGQTLAAICYFCNSIWLLFQALFQFLNQVIITISDQASQYFEFLWYYLDSIECLSLLLLNNTPQILHIQMPYGMQHIKSRTIKQTQSSFGASSMLKHFAGLQGSLIYLKLVNVTPLTKQ